MENELPAQAYVREDLRPGTPDWGAATLRYKLYRNCQKISLSQVSMNTPSEPFTQQLARMLPEIYGVTRQVHVVRDVPPSEEQHTTPEALGMSMFFRPVPSGGSLYPAELYVVMGNGYPIAAGVYHFDPVHNALDVLRQGDYTPDLSTIHGSSSDRSSTCTLVLSCLFWKDGFKYGQFSYRLQGLDIGAIIGQSMIVARQYGVEAIVHYQFVDDLVNQLVGIEGLYESAYAVVTLSSESWLPSTGESFRTLSISQAAPVEATSVVTQAQIEPISYWPLASAVHRASFMDSSALFKLAGSLPPFRLGKRNPPISTGKSFALPACSIDPYLGMRKRRSAMGQFTRMRLTLEQIACMLASAMRRYPNDVDIDDPHAPIGHVNVYVAVNSADQLPCGLFRYSPQEHALELINSVDVTERLQEMQSVPANAAVNMADVSLCVFIVGDYEAGFHTFSDRWYRMQNMEAGVVVERLYLSAAALGLSCRASLGYHVRQANALLELEPGQSALIEVLISGERFPYRYYEQRVLS